MNTQTLAHEVQHVTRRLYRGTAVFNFLLSSEDTNGALAIIETHILAGTEPPRHVHDREDEIFIIKEGEISFFIGDNLIKGYDGDVIFAPRGVAHSFRIDTPSAKVTLVLTPGGFDQFFWKQSTPYSAGGPVAPVGPPSLEAIESLIKLSNEFGVRLV
jgi:quercetin dioxygenase-like cupin family protein